ncbi:hypothetical protein [Clostridium felsineum]|uniref:Uncharacterized protein n=1 Tax=Clostridium felsineum TaxID=36839 RepID=A0A1S8LQS9_9CLOT|nr:hypothetical protein [Clostridium felsineum]URZ07577.1 hypothetical protein CLROS_029160 [Clostridium felsineum]URZ12608.1 hypothetical protein CROST_033310 [Clostridium felsineum]
MKRKFMMFAIFILVIALGAAVPLNTTHAESLIMQIQGVNSAYKSSIDGDYTRVANYQPNNYDPIILDTKYPCILIRKTTGLGPVHISVDGKHLCDYDLNVNTDPEDIYTWGYDTEEDTDTTSYEIIFNNLTSGKHTITMSLSDKYHNTMRQDIDLIIP